MEPELVRLVPWERERFESLDEEVRLSLIEQLAQIHAVNHGWKRAQSLFGANASFAVILRAQKSRLQRQLLRDYPQAVTLELDPEIEGGDTYGLILREPVGGWWNAAHIRASELSDESGVYELTAVVPAAEAK